MYKDNICIIIVLRQEGEDLENLKLYRRRFIPKETVFLKDDKILFLSDEIMVTKWQALKPRSDFSKGYSYYYLKRGYKVSKFIDDNDNLICYYCDIIDVIFNKEENSYIFADLLADVIIYTDGSVKVVDLDEIADALDEGLISQDMAKRCLRNLNSLLYIIYNQGVKSLLKEEMEK